MKSASLLLITCEHAGQRIPAAWQRLFADEQAALASHRGFDPGAIEMARVFQRQADGPLFAHFVSRLLVEVNRSLGHRQLFSRISRGLEQKKRDDILAKYYFPHRRRVEAWLQSAAPLARVVHVACHTFTPELDGEIRQADVGLLYDSSRPRERDLAVAWQANIRRLRSDLAVRRNYPYLGKADGFTTYLRRRFAPGRYLGFELEVNQRWWDDRRSWRKLAEALSETLNATLSATPLGDTSSGSRRHGVGGL